MAFPCSGVAVSPGANLQGLIDAYPEGTTFCFAAGTYRLTDMLSMKSNDVLIGAAGSLGRPGAVLNGSKVVTTWTQSGLLWYSTGQTQNLVESSADTRCAAGYKGCVDDDDLYLDNTSLWQVTTKAEVVPGTFFFDHAANTIWIADNPSGHLLEATVATKALSACNKYCPTSGEQVKGFLIEKFSTPAQDAAAVAATDGLFQGNEVRFIHGGGVEVKSGGVADRNYIHDIGQLCLLSPSSVAAVFQNNEVAGCNTQGYKAGWEAGVSKFTNTTSILIDHNYIHDSGFNRVNGDGNGLWEDGNNIYAVFSNNYISNIASSGIVLEISHDTTVIGNRILDTGQCATCWSAGIHVENTDNAEISGNYLAGNVYPVVLREDVRSDCSTCHIVNDYVHANVMMIDTNYTGFKYSTTDQQYFTLAHAHWDYNTYYLGDVNGKLFGWNGDHDYTKDGWMGLGQDTHSVYYQS